MFNNAWKSRIVPENFALIKNFDITINMYKKKKNVQKNTLCSLGGKSLPIDHV